MDYHKAATHEEEHDSHVQLQLIATAVTPCDEGAAEYPHTTTWTDTYFRNQPDVEAVFDHDPPEEQEAQHYVFWTRFLSVFTLFFAVVFLSVSLSEPENKATVVVICAFLFALTCFLCSNVSAKVMAWWFTSMPVYHTALTRTGLRLEQHWRASLLDRLHIGPSSSRLRCVLHVAYKDIRDVEIGATNTCIPDNLQVHVQTKATDETSFIRQGIPTHNPLTFSAYLWSGGNGNTTSTILYRQISLYGLVNPYGFKKLLLQRVRQVDNNDLALEAPKEQEIYRASSGHCMMSEA